MFARARKAAHCQLNGFAQCYRPTRGSEIPLWGYPGGAVGELSQAVGDLQGDSLGELNGTAKGTVLGGINRRPRIRGNAREWWGTGGGTPCNSPCCSIRGMQGQSRDCRGALVQRNCTGGGIARSALQGGNAGEHAGNAGGPAICHYHPCLHLSFINIHICLLYTAVAMAKTVKR